MWELDLRREQLAKNMHASFFGCYAQQRPEAFLVINDLFCTLEFTNIIEIGSFDCGLSTMLALYSRNSNLPKVKDDAAGAYKNESSHRSPKNFNTFDIKIHDEGAIELVKSLGGNFHQADCFEKEDFIKDLIQQEGRSILFCDGGNKPKEINTFCKHLKEGDFIMGHDFFWGDLEAELFLDRKWYSKELCMADIVDTCNEVQIQPMWRQCFDPVAWFCGLKV